MNPQVLLPTLGRRRGLSLALAIVMAAAVVGLAPRAAHAEPGDVDTSFGAGDGVTEGPGSEANDIINGPDGTLVTAVQTFAESGPATGVERYLPDGTLDESFGDGGIARVDATTGEEGTGVAIQTVDGEQRYVVVGRGDNQLVLARFTADGTLDTSFGNGGTVVDSLDNERGVDVFSSGLEDVTILGDGSIVAVGEYNPNEGDEREGMLVIKYTPNGERDTTFGEQDDGFTLLPVGINPEGRSVAVQPDGRIVVAGEGDRGAALGRVLADGTIDQDFGTDGVTTFHFGQPDYFHTFEDVLVLPGGRIAAAGGSDQLSGGANNADTLVARVTAEGELDTSFGEDGFVTRDVSESARTDAAAGLAVDAACGLIVGGATSSATDDGTGFFGLRVGPGGALDPGYGTEGIAGPVENGISAYHAITQPDGDLVVAGVGNGESLLVRFEGDPASVGQPTAEECGEDDPTPDPTPTPTPTPSPSPSPSETPTGEPEPFQPGVSRIQGSGSGDVKDIAIDACNVLIADGEQARSVLLAREDVFADALTGAPLAGDDSCVLFTAGGPDAPLTPATRAEIERVLPDGGLVRVLGGVNAVSAAAETELRDAGFTTERFGGETRFQTAVEIARVVRAENPGGDSALVAFAFDWPDAVTGGAFGADTGTPVLLTDRDALHPATQAAIGELGVTRSTVLGGTAVVSDQAMSQLPAPQRVFGANRMATAVDVTETLWTGLPTYDGERFVVVNLSRANAWTLALAAAPLSAKFDAPQLGVNVDTYPTETEQFLESQGFETLPSFTLIGDLSFIDANVEDSLDEDAG